MDVDLNEYCRALESHLLKVNGGHLIRISGPAFDTVRGWAERGVPLKVAQRGIDRYCDRDRAKGPRRRPVQITFCEADVLDVYDEWRRAVGLGATGAGGAPGVDGAGGASGAGGGEEPGVRGRRRDSLAAHLERVVARLTALRAGEDRSLDEVFEAAVRELDVARAGAKGLRGAAREALLGRLRELDASLLVAVRERCDTATLRLLEQEADVELAPFRERMPAEAYAQSRRACVDRLLRERARLPVVAIE
jgi:hypothetical protein